LSTSERDELRKLRREVVELRRANAILRETGCPIEQSDDDFAPAEPDDERLEAPGIVRNAD
jgi:hypothetical protein